MIVHTVVLKVTCMAKIREKETPVFYRRKVSLEPISMKDILSIPKLLEVHKPYKQRALVCDLPDLWIESYTADYVGEDYTIKAIVKNIGSKKSNPTLVYCNAISLIPHPGVNDIRIQGREDLGEIQPGETATCSFKFKLSDLHAKEVGRIQIIVDPKDFVAECNEFNNTEQWPWPS